MPTRPASHRSDLRARPAAVAAPQRADPCRADTPEQREADRLRSTARWQRLRMLVLRREPLCRACTDAGRTTPATEVDHIAPLQRSLDLAFVESNLQPLCRPCHMAKTAAERRS